MSSDLSVVSQPDGTAVAAAGIDERDLAKSTVEVPSTPLPTDVIPASQDTILSTEIPGSPMDTDDSFRTDVADLPTVIPSSQTPPPSSQVENHVAQHQQKLCAPQSNHNGSNGYTISWQRSAILSPPGTGLATTSRGRRESTAASAFSGSEFVPPTPNQIAGASPDDLRMMLQASLAEHTRLKMEAAHHKLQHNLLSMQADEDAKRAAVEHEMTRREVEALRQVENARQARREIGAAAELSQAKYLQIKGWYDELLEENESLQKRVKLAKRIIQQKEEEMANLGDEKELLLNRLRENREHFHLLCSPGGIFHGAMTPKTGTSPVHTRATQYQTPRAKAAGGNGGRLGKDNSRGLLDRDQGTEPIAALLQALSQQENNSAPNTPITGHRPPPRNVARHQRNVQSLSSLPTTPTSRPRGGYSGLLPSADLVPQTEPAPLRFSEHYGAGNGSHSYMPETPTRRTHRHRLPDLQERRRSRESTISADEDHDRHDANEELARQALESVAARAAQHQHASTTAPSSLSFSRPSQGSLGGSQRPDEEVLESQASQAALAMLRRDPRESFEVTGSADNSRDGTPATTEKSAKLQAKLFGGLNKSSSTTTTDKRKFGNGSSHMGGSQGSSDELPTSPTKKVRVVPSLRDNNDSHWHRHQQQQQQQQQQADQQPPRVGLGIQYN